MDESYDVPDSTDWLNTPLAGLMPVEQAFRCHVCKDFYTSPMLTSCNHTFCSICIRRCLSVDGKCPLCRANDQESKLRGNWALREAVDAFITARPAILEIARTPAAPPPRLSSPKRKADELEDSPSESVQDGKRLRMSTRSSKTRGSQATAAMAREEADLYIEDTIEEAPYQPDDGLVACPICWARMKEAQVDKHLDKSCPGSPQPPKPQPAAFRFPPSPSRPSTSKPPERLPALAYSMLKDQALRKKLSELGLSTVGARPLLERRHQEWITLWNANCDSARPKKRAELMHDLDVWERTVGGRAPATTRSSVLGAQIKDKEFDGAAWATRHDDSFRDLIANARKTRAAAVPPAPAKPEGEEAQAESAAKDAEEVVGGGDVSTPAAEPPAVPETQQQQYGSQNSDQQFQHQQGDSSQPNGVRVTLYSHQGTVRRPVVGNEEETYAVLPNRDFGPNGRPWEVSRGGYAPPVSSYEQAPAPIPEPILDERSKAHALFTGSDPAGGGGGYAPPVSASMPGHAVADRSRFYPAHDRNSPVGGGGYPPPPSTHERPAFDRPPPAYMGSIPFGAGTGMPGGDYGGYAPPPPVSPYPEPPARMSGPVYEEGIGYRSEPAQGYSEGRAGPGYGWEPWSTGP
ncbi:hypothetical protein QBC39DRAFT_333984 [Podospora conica]|nr:hypothetical protein QBC39DRAFT_333984 [Schizothecium conicum]